MEANKQVVVVPEHLDVLCGSGQKVNRHPGNMRFRQVVASNLASYTVAVTKSEKSAVSQTVFEELTTSTGARFLKKHSIFDKWHVATDKAARDKISHCLRRMNREQQQAGGRRGAADQEAVVVQPQVPPAVEPAVVGVAVASVPLLPDSRAVPQVSPNEPAAASHGDDLLLALQGLQEEGTQQLVRLPADGVISSSNTVIDPDTISLYEPSRSFPPVSVFANNAAPSRGNPDPAFLNLDGSPPGTAMQPATGGIAPHLIYPAQESSKTGSVLPRESAPASCYISSSGVGIVGERDQLQHGARSDPGKMGIEQKYSGGDAAHKWPTPTLTMSSQEGASLVDVLLGHAPRSGVSQACMASPQGNVLPPKVPTPAESASSTSKLYTNTTSPDQALTFRPNQEKSCSSYGPPAG